MKNATNKELSRIVLVLLSVVCLVSLFSLSLFNADIGLPDPAAQDSVAEAAGDVIDIIGNETGSEPEHTEGGYYLIETAEKTFVNLCYEGEGTCESPPPPRG